LREALTPFSLCAGEWAKRNPLPAEYSRWGAFEQLAEQNMTVLREILDAAAAAPGGAGSVTQQVGDLWRGAALRVRARIVPRLTR